MIPYTILDLESDIGGFVVPLFEIIFLFVWFNGQDDMNWKFIKNLYLIGTKNEKNEKVGKRVSSVIQFKEKTSIQNDVSSKFKSIMIEKDTNQYKRIFERGKLKVNEELNIFNILSLLRKIKASLSVIIGEDTVKLEKI